MKKIEMKKDNRGFTLVELLVALLVCSLVVLAAAGFLSVSVNNFNSTNTEISLQTESQIALNLVENLLIQSTSCEYVPEFAYDADEEGNALECELIKIGMVDGSNTYLYLVIRNPETNQLLLKKLTAAVTATPNYENVIGDLGTTVKTEVKNAIEASRPALLADYVQSITVSPNRLTTDTNDILRVNISLEKNNKTYTSSTNVSMRNGTHR